MTRLTEQFFLVVAAAAAVLAVVTFFAPLFVIIMYANLFTDFHIKRNAHADAVAPCKYHFGANKRSDLDASDISVLTGVMASDPLVSVRLAPGDGHKKRATMLHVLRPTGTLSSTCARSHCTGTTAWTTSCSR